MECERYQEEMVLRLYSEPGTGEPGFDSHLDSCTACREQLDEMDEVSLLYRESAREPLPLKLRRRILQGSETGGRWLHYVAAAFVAAFLVGFLIWPTPDEPVTAVSWDTIDFEAEKIVIQLTPDEKAYAMKYADAPPRWDEVSFRGPALKRIENQIEKVRDKSPW